MFSHPLRLSGLAILMIVSSGTANGQALSEIHIGDDAARLSTLAARPTGPEQRTKWGSDA